MSAVGVTLTVATGIGGGGFTVISAPPLCPSLVAVIVALPAATAVTTPLLDTVATLGALVFQLTERPYSMPPFASRVAAESIVLPPADTVALLGVTVTEATATGAGGGGALTVTLAVAVFPSEAAVIVAVPGATPTTLPLPFTVAIWGALELHVIVRPVSTFFFVSVRVAERA